MYQHHNQLYLGSVPLNRKTSWVPLGWVVFPPTEIFPLVTPTRTLVTRTLVLVAAVITLVPLVTLVILVTLVTLVLVASVITLVSLVTLVGVTLVTRPMDILGLLVGVHQEG